MIISCPSLRWKMMTSIETIWQTQQIIWTMESHYLLLVSMFSHRSTHKTRRSTIFCCRVSWSIEKTITSMPTWFHKYIHCIFCVLTLEHLEFERTAWFGRPKSGTLFPSRFESHFQYFKRLRQAQNWHWMFVHTCQSDFQVLHFFFTNISYLNRFNVITFIFVEFMQNRQKRQRFAPRFWCNMWTTC